MPNHYPYCIHGKYVGGCGADYMCFACEMGDDPTPEQEAADARARREWAAASDEENFWSLPAQVLDGP